MDNRLPPGDVNPYAPSATIAQPDPFALAGVGYWRHGTLLVLHEDAYLPPVCVKSGKPAAGYRQTPIRWTHVLRWPAEHVQFAVPLTARAMYWHGPGRRWVLVATALAAIVGLVATAVVGQIEWPEGNQEAIGFTIVLGVIAVVCLLTGWATLAQPLWIVRRKRKYYWLSGAHKKFLAQIPSWPYA